LEIKQLLGEKNENKKEYDLQISNLTTQLHSDNEKQRESQVNYFSLLMFVLN
jgi:hypothetical protein